MNRVTKFIEKDPPMAQDMTFDPRESASHYLASFLRRCEIPNEESLLDGIFKIVESLPNLKEEGIALRPNVIIFLDDLYNCVKFENQQFSIKINVGEKTTETYQKALKLCAPLANHDKSVYLSLQKSQIEFGILLASAAKIIQTSTADTLNYLSGQIDESKIISIVVNNDTGMVAIRHKDAAYRINTVLIPSDIDQTTSLETSLINAICRDIPNDSEKWDVKNKLLPAVTNAINDSHGCIIAVVNSNKNSIEQIKKHLRDGIYLDTPIDFPQIINQAKETKGLAEYLLLQELLEIQKRMISMDGITLFDTTGKLLAYKVFAKTGTNQQGGGARSRAFNTLSNLRILDCCFFKSQDGKKEIKQNKKNTRTP